MGPGHKARDDKERAEADALRRERKSLPFRPQHKDCVLGIVAMPSPSDIDAPCDGSHCVEAKMHDCPVGPVVPALRAACIGPDPTTPREGDLW